MTGKRVLITAPYVGEIGWELMSWQGRVRRIFAQGGYERLIVLGQPGKAAFYDGMPLEYREVALDHIPGEPYEDRRILPDPGQCVPAEQLRHSVDELVQPMVADFRERGITADVLWPGYDGSLWLTDARYQQFLQYKRPVKAQPSAPWVVLVQRTRALRATENWPASSWSELRELLEARGVHTSVYPCEAEAAIEMLSGCDLAVGQTTGGMHLAALCDCPRLTWSLYSMLIWQWEITDRQRFETWWNPLGSPVIFNPVRQLPTPQAAADQVMHALGTIGRRTGSALYRAAFNCKYAVKSALTQCIIEPQRYAGWPWALQKLVRYQLA